MERNRFLKFVTERNRFLKFVIQVINFINSLDSQISRNLQTAVITTRQAETNGLWCCFLLPAVLNVYVIQCDVCDLYKLVAFTSVGLLAYSLLLILFLSISGLALRDTVYGGCLSSSILAILLIYTCLDQELMFSLYFSVPPVFLYSWLLRKALAKYPKTFTIGEAMVFVQGIVLFTVMTIAKFTTEIGEHDEEIKIISTVVYTELATVGIIIGAIYLLREDQKNLNYLCFIFAISLVFALVTLHSVMGRYTLLLVLKYIFTPKTRAAIIALWLALAGAAGAAVCARTALAVRADTVARKTFHVLAAAVFLTGTLADLHLMLLAAGVAFGLFLLLEALRKSKIDPISSALQSAFLIYVDEKDSGEFSMTAVYLYLGLACPLLLVPWGDDPGAGAGEEGDVLELLSGVLALGVGDTAASWFGSKYGFNKWSGGNRTYEGTAFNILSQVATVYALQLFELLEANNAVVRTAVAATFAGLVEAKTHQVDNLVLPLVTIAAFQATWFLR